MGSMDTREVHVYRGVRSVGLWMLVLFIVFYGREHGMLAWGEDPEEYALTTQAQQHGGGLAALDTSVTLRSNNPTSDVTQDSVRTALATSPPDTSSYALPLDGKDRVLLIGDSQLEGLQSPVSAYCEKNEVELAATVIWYGSSTKHWALSDTLDYFLKRYKPTVVFFAIGLNELFVRDLDKRTNYVREVKRKLEAHGVRYTWIGPAAWTRDKGIVAVMQKEVGEPFFASHHMQMDRASDGRHPTRRAAKLWFDEVAAFASARGVVDFGTPVDTLPKLRYRRTITLNVQ